VLCGQELMIDVENHDQVAMFNNGKEQYIDTFLSLQDQDFWDDAEDASPGIVTRLTTELDSFASFLRN
jgi:hypothetical protein